MTLLVPSNVEKLQLEIISIGRNIILDKLYYYVLVMEYISQGLLFLLYIWENERLLISRLNANCFEIFSFLIQPFVKN